MCTYRPAIPVQSPLESTTPAAEHPLAVRLLRRHSSQPQLLSSLLRLFPAQRWSPRALPTPWFCLEAVVQAGSFAVMAATTAHRLTLTEMPTHPLMARPGQFQPPSRWV